MCKRFAAIADVAFGQKYANNVYEVFSENEQSSEFHRAILLKFGEKLSSISIDDCLSTSEWYLEIVAQKHCNLKTFYLSDMDLYSQFIEHFVSLIENN